MKQKNPNSNACCRYVVDDVGIVRRAPQGVMLAALSQFLKSLRDKKTPYMPMFLAPRKPKTMVFMFFFALDIKNHGIYILCFLNNT